MWLASLFGFRPYQTFPEGPEDSAIPVRLRRDVLIERLKLERDMRKWEIESFVQVLITVLFLAQLLVEVPHQEMHDIRQNLWSHFKLDDVSSINSFDGVYEYLYTFMDAAERFDPLDRERYVDRDYGLGPELGTFVASGPDKTEDVVVLRQKRFSGISALLIRPQVMMLRAEQIPCNGFAKEYDRLYSMARYLRYKYRGATIEGAWQPHRVHLKYGLTDEARVLAQRKSTDTPGVSAVSTPSESEGGVENQWGSELLVCTDFGKINSTMRTKLRTAFHNIAFDIGDVRYSGDFVAEKTDVLAYMGYNVYNVNSTTHPRCLFQSIRDPLTGEIVEGGQRVTLSDVAERCEKTPDRWSDVQTKEISAKVFLYTPVVELFTELHVQFDVGQTGHFHSRGRIESFQLLRRTDRWPGWLALLILQLLLMVTELCLVLVRVRRRRVEEKQYSRAAMVTIEEKAKDTFSIVLQLTFIAFCLYRLIREVAGLDLWSVFEDIMVRNPYASYSTSTETVDLMEQITGAFQEYDVVRAVAFLLVLATFLQFIFYLGMHPRTAILAHTIKVIASDVFNFLLFFGTLYLALCVAGMWAFGSKVSAFSSLGSSISMGFFWALGQFEGGLEDELGSVLDVYLLYLWIVFFLIICFLFGMNMLLAIVVDGYAEVKEQLKMHSHHQGFLTDAICLYWGQTNYVTYKWPKRIAILDFLERMPREMVTVTAVDLARSGLFDHSKATRVPNDAASHARRFALLYQRMVPAVCAGAQHGEHVAEQAWSEPGLLGAAETPATVGATKFEDPLIIEELRAAVHEMRQEIRSLHMAITEERSGKTFPHVARSSADQSPAAGNAAAPCSAEPVASPAFQPTLASAPGNMESECTPASMALPSAIPSEPVGPPEEESSPRLLF